ncbi:hypothetical protein MG1601_152 [Mycoplasmoides gallisepticum]
MAFLLGWSNSSSSLTYFHLIVAVTSLSGLAALNFTFGLGGILVCAPVIGLTEILSRPIVTLKVPSSGNLTWPWDLISFFTKSL